MLKKISLIGFLVLSFEVAYSATQGPEIFVDGAPSSTFAIHRVEGAIIEELPLSSPGDCDEKQARACRIRTVLDLLHSMRDKFVGDQVPWLNDVLSTSVDDQSFLMVKLGGPADLKPVMPFTKTLYLAALDTQDVEEKDLPSLVPTIVSLLDSQAAQKLFLLDLELAYLNCDISTLSDKICASSLYSLSMDYCNMGESGHFVPITYLESIVERCPTLAHLNISGNDLGDEGAQAMGRALATNTTLLLLSLAANNIGPEGAKSLAVGLLENSTLKSLNLSFNPVTDGGAWSFVRRTANTGLVTLRLKDCEITPFTQGELFEEVATYTPPKRLIFDEELMGDLEVEHETPEDRKRRLSSVL